MKACAAVGRRGGEDLLCDPGHLSYYYWGGGRARVVRG